jgi:catechol 2,3-dioxygenase
MSAVGSYGVRPTGFRLPDATRPGLVRLQVSRLQTSLDYYEAVLGLQRLAEGERMARLGAADGRVLLELVERPGARPVPGRGAFGLYHFAILLPDRAALKRFARHLASLAVQIGMADHLVSEALYLTDPDGLGIEVYADRPRDTWRVRDQELVMASDPLDIRGVMAEAGAAPWSGMPVGTTMGHMHLHVGSLAGAEAFYHAALGFDKIVWSYPGALFLSAGGYHHHLGTNTWSAGPSAADDQARLLEWTLEVPSAEDVSAVAQSLRGAGHVAEDAGDAVVTADPWGTRLRLQAAPAGR